VGYPLERGVPRLLSGDAIGGHFRQLFDFLLNEKALEEA
jgi:hypothetical protein